MDNLMIAFSIFIYFLFNNVHKNKKKKAFGKYNIGDIIECKFNGERMIVCILREINIRTINNYNKIVNEVVKYEVVPDTIPLITNNNDFEIYENDVIYAHKKKSKKIKFSEFLLFIVFGISFCFNIYGFISIIATLVFCLVNLDSNLFVCGSHDYKGGQTVLYTNDIYEYRGRSAILKIKGTKVMSGIVNEIKVYSYNGTSDIFNEEYFEIREEYSILNDNNEIDIVDRRNIKKI